MLWMSQTMPAYTVIVGDTVVLQARQVMPASATLSWSLTPSNGTNGTIRPPGSTLVVLYPTEPGDYHAHLTVTDPMSGMFCEITNFAFRALGPQPLPNNAASAASNQVNDLSAGGQQLWTATGDRAWRIALDPGMRSGWQDVRTAFPQGVGFAMNNLGAVFYDGSDSAVWYAVNGPQPSVFKVDLTGANIDAVDIAGAAGGNAKANEFSRGGGPVHVATDHGLLQWSSGSSFTNRQFIMGMENLSTVTEVPATAVWAGGPSLQSFGGGSCTPCDVFPGGDDKIRALRFETGDNNILWVGSDGFGLGKYNISMGTRVDTLTTQSAPPRQMPSDKIRAIVIDGLDVWLATDQGAARFKRDPGAVITYGLQAPGQPLAGPQLDTRALVVDYSTGPRRVFLGTAAGVLVLEVPP